MLPCVNILYLLEAKCNVFCPVLKAIKHLIVIWLLYTILSYTLCFMTERSNNNFFYWQFRYNVNAPNGNQKQECSCVLLLNVSLTKHFKNRMCPKSDILFKTTCTWKRWRFTFFLIRLVTGFSFLTALEREIKKTWWPLVWTLIFLFKESFCTQIWWQYKVKYSE